MTTLNCAPRLAELLGELNYEGFRSLGFTKLLLVEGRTDVKVFIEFLKTYNKDHEFLVVPLGGSGFINGDCEDELQELLRISSEVFCVIDSERHSESESLSGVRERFLKICEDLGIKCHVLSRRATENYLDDHAVARELGASFRALSPFESRSDLPNSWPKSNNWKIARHVTLEHLNSTDLGDFLRSI